MGEMTQVEADHLSPGQRYTIRRSIEEAIAEHGIEWAMRNTCAQLEAKYGISYDTIEYLLHAELPAVLPEELLTSGQRNKVRRDFSAATSITTQSKDGMLLPRRSGNPPSTSECQKTPSAPLSVSTAILFGQRHHPEDHLCL